MRRRFGRRRRSESEDRRSPPLDAGRELARLLEPGRLPVRTLEPAADTGVPAGFAVVGVGETNEGRPLVVGVSPRSGGDAWLAALAVATRLVEEQGFAGPVWAASPSWPLVVRRRLSLLRSLPFRVEAWAQPAGPELERDVAPEPLVEPASATPSQLAAALDEPAEREILLRGTAALEGLASKHGGRVRISPRGVELVLLARPVATLRVEGGRVALTAALPRRTTLPLDSKGFADALDRLEGFIRKYLNEKKIREGIEGTRGRLEPLLARAVDVRERVRWPLPGTDPDPLDFVGVDPRGRPVLGAVREELDLEGLGALLDALIELWPRLPALLAHATPTMRLATPILAVAAERFDPCAERVLAALKVENRLYRIETRGRERVLTPHEGAPMRSATGAIGRPGPTPASESAPQAPPASVVPQEAEAPPPRRRFEELSVFDLSDEGRAEPEPTGREARGGARRRRRGRGRGRGRESEPASDRPSAEDERQGRDGDLEASRGGRAPRAAADEAEAQVAAGSRDDDDLEDTLEPAPVEVPDLPEEGEAPYEEDDEEEAEEEPLRREREARRRARLAKAEPEPAPQPEPAPRAPRRRAALVAHADRDSIGAAIVLARDLRLVEGLWVYPQGELMTFFRSVATDLREETPIHVVGFTASPLRDTLQAASLYRDRLSWYDHHVWPPEDLESLRRAIGEENVRVVPGAGSSLPVVLARCTRRSRFTDKLVDVLTGRFSQHDYERWGRLWWSRLGEIAQRSGERRAEVAGLLTGRPSELAREAAATPTPAPPPEFDFVAGQDFRLVHSGGHVVALVPVPPALDVHLTARIARERYAALLAVAWAEGEEWVLLSGDETSARRTPDLGALVAHLAEKFAWVSALPDDDHVARFRVAELTEHPERLEEIVGEIAMARSLLEG